jgi:hypothetical protein
MVAMDMLRPDQAIAVQFVLNGLADVGSRRGPNGPLASCTVDFG